MSPLPLDKDDNENDTFSTAPTLENLSSASSSDEDEDEDYKAKPKPNPKAEAHSQTTTDTADSSISNAKIFACKPSAVIWRDLHLVLVPEDGNSAAKTASAAAAAGYFLDVSQFTPGTPDLVLHLGGDKKGPVLGTAYLHRMAAMDCEIVDGGAIAASQDDGGRDGSVQQKMKVKVERKGLMNKSYSFEYQGRKFVLSRTRDPEDGVTGLRKMFIGNYKIVDVERNKTVATYVTESAGRSSGTLKMASDLDPSMEVLVILAVCGWREKWRRKKNAGQRRLF